MITEEQINQLHWFCKRKGVHYYDLQQELADHLAAGIEEKMRTDAQLSFENALQEVQASFDKPGFSKIVKERRRTLQNGAKKSETAIFNAYFAFPKVMTSLLLFLVLYLCIHPFKIKPGTLYIFYNLLFWECF